jgi:hypothetical protein
MARTEMPVRSFLRVVLYILAVYDAVASPSRNAFTRVHLRRCRESRHLRVEDNPDEWCAGFGAHAIVVLLCRPDWVLG